MNGPNICQSEDGEEHPCWPSSQAVANIQPLPSSSFVPLPLPSRPGPGGMGSHAISAVFISHMVRSTAHRYNTVCRRLRYFCVRPLTLPGEARWCDRLFCNLSWSSLSGLVPITWPLERWQHGGGHRPGLLECRIAFEGPEHRIRS